jgi:HD superfamily phosphohydrolase
MRVKTFRDVIWGDIELKEEEIDIVDSKPFQRLRRIKQLGLADLVYPCAKHTRFDHSLGTLSAAQLIVDKLVNNHKSPENRDALDDDTIDRIRCYALLHDISHIPFGHTLEDEGVLYKRHDEGERGKYYIDQLKGIIPSNIYESVSELLEEKVDKNNKFISDIVSNTICADLIDYIQRDGYFTGATGLRFKFDDRLLKFMTIGYDEDGGRRLIFKPIKDKIRIDVITDIIQLLRYRYMITERVTFHHARCAANAMLIKAIQLLGPPKEDIFYWMGDEDVLTYISGSDDKNIRELGKMLKCRTLFKLVFRVTRDTASKLPEGSVKDVSNKYGEPKGRMKLEDEIIEEITKIRGLSDFANSHLAIYCPPDKNMAFKETKVLVQWKGAYPLPLREVEAEFRWENLILKEVKDLEDKYQALWNMYIFIHPKYMRYIYEIEKRCESVLGVENDPLLRLSFEQQETYKSSIKFEEKLLGMGIVETAVKLSAQAARGGTEDEEEVLKRAIQQTIPSVEVEVPFEDARGKKNGKKK